MAFRLVHHSHSLPTGGTWKWFFFFYDSQSQRFQQDPCDMRCWSFHGSSMYLLQSSRKTVNTRENFWNVCFATNQKQDETAKDNHETAAWVSHDLIRNNELAFSSNKLALLPGLTFKNQSTEFGIVLEVSVNCQNLQRYKFLDEGFSAPKKYGSKITNHSQLAWPFQLHVKHTSQPRFWLVRYFFALRRAV